LLRYGGEEFRLPLPNTGAVRAVEIGEMVPAAVGT
jgi:PleD family two-component response regulator